jgi:xylitol oxidase
MGVVTRLTLDVLPRYDVEQRVYEDLPLAALRGRFDEVLAAGDSVSLFTTWRDDVVDQVWVKRRIAAGDVAGTAGAALPSPLLAAPPAGGPRHPVPGMDPAACTEQLGVPGPWHERLPHFRLDHKPSAGDELQSEWFVDARHVAEAFDALHALRRRTSPLLLVSEIRTVAADDLWLSPAYGRPSVAFHFTWRPDWAAVRPAIDAIETALAPFEPRAHWAKLFAMAPEAVAAAHPRHADARSLAAALDPAGKLRNAFLDRYLFAGGS